MASQAVFGRRKLATYGVRYGLGMSAGAARGLPLISAGRP